MDQDNRKKVLSEALTLIQKAKRDRAHVAAGDIARVLRWKFPDSGFEFVELENEVARLAMNNGVATIEFGSRPKSGT